MSGISDINDKRKKVEFIKSVGKITVLGVCKEEHVKTSNFYSLKVSNETLERIKSNIDKKIKDLYEGYNEDSTL